MRILPGCLLLVALVGGCATVVPQQPVEAIAITQDGTATTVGLGEQTVYYPVPFLSKPNLEVTPADGKVTIMHLEQYPDRFTVTAVPGLFGQPGATLRWKARGPVPRSLAPATPTDSTTFATAGPTP